MPSVNGNPPIVEPPAHVERVQPLTWNSSQTAFSNIATFVNSLFGSSRNIKVVTDAIDACQLAATFCDTNSRGMILQAWLEAWSNATRDTAAPTQCPATDAALISFLVQYIQDFYTNSGQSLCLCIPQLTLARPSSGSDTKPTYLNRGYIRLPFIRHGTWCLGSFDSEGNVQEGNDGSAVARFLWLLFHGAHMVVVSVDDDTDYAVYMTNFKDAFKTEFEDSDLANVGITRDSGNSHYVNLMNVTSYYFLDIEQESEPSYEPLICAFLTGSTSNGNYNSFIQLEGWQANIGNNDWHMADYDKSIATFWNFSTFGACAYAEKRSTSVFIAPPDFDLRCDVLTRMPLYDGAGSAQGWMAYDLAVFQETAIQGNITWMQPQAGPGGDGACIVACSQGVVALWSSGHHLYYRVGTYMRAGNAIVGVHWFGTAGTQFDSGQAIKGAMNEYGIVEVHRSQHGNNLYWNAGKVDFAHGTIAWNPGGHHYDDGDEPCIALSSDNKVFEAHVTFGGASSAGRLFCRVGTASFSDTAPCSVSFQDSGRVSNSSGDLNGTATAAAWLAGGHVLLAYVDQDESATLRSTVGIASTSSVSWGSSYQYSTSGRSMQPSLTAFSTGQVVEVHTLHSAKADPDHYQTAYVQSLVLGLPIINDQSNDNRMSWSHTAVAPGFLLNGLRASVAGWSNLVFVNSGAECIVGTLALPLAPSSVIPSFDNESDIELFALGLIDSVPWVLAKQDSSGSYKGQEVLPGQQGGLVQLAMGHVESGLLAVGLSNQGQPGVVARYGSNGWSGGLWSIPSTSDTRYTQIAVGHQANDLYLFGIRTSDRQVELISEMTGFDPNTWTAGMSPNAIHSDGRGYSTIRAYSCNTARNGSQVMVLGLDSNGGVYLATQKLGNNWTSSPLNIAGSVTCVDVCGIVEATQSSTFLVFGLDTNGHAWFLASISGTTVNSSPQQLDTEHNYSSIAVGRGNNGYPQILGISNGVIRLVAWMDSSNNIRPGGNINVLPNINWTSLQAPLGSGPAYNLQVWATDSNGVLYLATWQRATDGTWHPGTILP